MGISARGIAGVVGRVLMVLGAVVFLFVAYELWGTALTESHDQSALRRQFDKELATTPSSLAAPALASGSAITEGQPVAIIDIPEIGVDKVVVQGTSTADLRQGPGHYPGTPLPGQPGNAAIAGHRTTYGAPFFDLDHLARGDVIVMTTAQGRFRYAVTSTLVVDPDDTAVVGPTPFAELTLTTCNPRFSAAQRLVVHARLRGRAAPAKAGATGTGANTTGTASGLAGEEGDWVGALEWGLTVVGIGLALALFARHRRRVGRLLRGRYRSRTGRRVYAAVATGVGVVGVAGFLTALFFMFQALSPLLPASY